MDSDNLIKIMQNAAVMIETQRELIDILYSQVVDLTMMSKIELGDDVIAEINRLKTKLRELEHEITI